MVASNLIMLVLLLYVSQERGQATPFLDRNILDEEREGYLLIPIGETFYESPQVGVVTMRCRICLVNYSFQ